MATIETEVKIDLDAVDAEAAKKDKTSQKADENTAIEVVHAKETPKTPDKDVLTPDAGLEKLKKQLEDERTARQAADRRAAEASKSEVEARTEVQITQLDIVKNAIETVKQSQKILRTEYAAAMAAQDFEKVAEINETISDNSARLLQLENGKSALEKAPKPIARAVTDPIDEFAGRLSPRSGAWVRAHPEFVRDPQKNRQMLAAHELALARGIAADTDDYFESIEDTLRLKKADPSANGSSTHIEVDPTGADDPTAYAAKSVQQRRAPPAAAPVSRSGNGTGGSRPNVVTLSSQEVEIASLMGMSPEEYARQKIALKREGRLQ